METIQRLRTAGATGVQGRSGMHARLRQGMRDFADGIVRDRNKKARRVLRQLAVGDRLRAASHEGNRGRRTLRVPARYRHYRFPTLAQQPPKGLPHTARAGNRHRLAHRSLV